MTRPRGLRAMLLASVALAALLALPGVASAQVVIGAGGGAGGIVSTINGGAGGATGVRGQDGTAGLGGGGAGGAAGTIISPNGGDGNDGGLGGGGGGGGGGFSNSVSGDITIAISGGNGGNGGNAALGGGGGGGGGDGARISAVGPVTVDAAVSGGNGGNGRIIAGGGGGGAGVVLQGGGGLTVNAAVTGGNGGDGGSGSSGSGGGGAGVILQDGGNLTVTAQITGGSSPGLGTEGQGDAGAGVVLGAAGSVTNAVGAAIKGGNASFAGSGGAGVALLAGGTVVNAGTILGGNGGGSSTGGSSGVSSGGAGSGGAAGGTGAPKVATGGAGITGAGLTIINSGSITGGGGSFSGVQANAITFTGGVNRLELQAGSTIVGTVDATAGTSNTLALGGAANSTFDVSQVGAAAQYRGFQGFEKTGTSTWALTGTTTAVTPWTISQGALNVGSDGALGAAAGGLTLNGGTLQFGASFTTARGITLNAVTGNTIDRGDFETTIAGAISGPGGFSKTGLGTLILTGSNTYSGTTTISAGVLQLGNGGTSGSIAGNVINNSLFAIHRSDTVTLGGVISGSGLLIQNGTGTTILTANNTYGPGGTGQGSFVTTINAGTLQLGNGGSTGSIIGSVVNNSTLAFNRADTYSFDGIITNAGSVRQAGTGTTILTAASTYTGATTVDAGTLSVNGSIASSVLTTVNAGGTLGGNGVVGNTSINGGTLAPGNSIGLLTVNGSLTLTAASSYLVEVSPANADRVNVTGSATLGGATVNASFAPGTYVAKQYTILHADGGRNGTFAGPVNSNLPSNFTSTLSYDGNNAYLDLALIFTPPTGPGPYSGLNVNQQNVANTLTNFFNSTGGIPLVFGSLTPAGLTQVSGEAATGAQQTTFDAMNLFLGLLTDPFVTGRGAPVGGAGASPFVAEDDDIARAYAGRRPRSASERDAYAAIYRKAPLAPVDERRWSVWTAGFGGTQTTDGNATLGSNTATSRIAQAAVGADYWFSPYTVAGFALAGGATSFSVANSGTGRSDLFQAGAFVRHNVGPAYVTAALTYGWQDVTTDRTIGADHLQARFNANSYSGRIESGYRLVAPWTGGIGVTPYAAGQFTTIDLPAYAEQAISGTNIFALSYASKSVTASRSELGLRADKSFALADSILTLRGRAAWAHNFDPDRSIAATFQALPGASFVVNGAAQARDAALTTLSAEMTWRNGFSLAATFEGEFSDVTASYAGKGIVRYAW